MTRDAALAQGGELGVAHVVLGVIGPPRAEPHAPCAVGFEHVIKGGQEREAELVSGLAGLPLSVAPDLIRGRAAFCHGARRSTVPGQAREDEEGDRLRSRFKCAAALRRSQRI